MTTTRDNSYFDNLFQYGVDEDGNDSSKIATTTLASAADVELVLRAPLNDQGRSEWFWITTERGDTALACFPSGDTYCALDYTNYQTGYPVT